MCKQKSVDEATIWSRTNMKINIENALNMGKNERIVPLHHLYLFNTLS